jgi:hypothetical protein
MAHTQGFNSLNPDYSCWPFTSRPPTSVPNAHPETIMLGFTGMRSSSPLSSEEFPNGICFQRPLLPHTTITSSRLPISAYQVPTSYVYDAPSTGPKTVATQDTTPHPPARAAPTHNLHDVNVEITPHPSQKGKYTKRQLYDLVQVALKVNFFMAQHGEKGTTLKAFGNGCRKLGIKGSNTILKDCMLELLAYHDVRFHLISLYRCQCSCFILSHLGS